MLLGFKYKPLVANARDYAYQLISIPEDAKNVTLSFQCHFFTYDRYDYDWFEAYVTPMNGTPNLVYKVGGQYRGVLREQPWIKVTTDISRYANESVYLYFAVANWNNANYRTWCYIDDVSVACTRNGTGQMKIYGNPNINLLTPPPNSPPNAPTTPSGLTSGYTGVSYTYSTSTNDPEGAVSVTSLTGATAQQQPQTGTHQVHKYHHPTPGVPQEHTTSGLEHKTP